MARAEVIQGLLDRGFPPHVAQGIAGNIAVESGFDPGINEIAPLVPGSRGGFGLFQHTGPRRRELEAYAQSRGLPVDSIDTQLDFALQELQTTERRAGEALAQTTTAEEAARVFSEQFLRPGIPHLDRRIAAATGTDVLAGGSGDDTLQETAEDRIHRFYREGLLSPEMRAQYEARFGVPQQEAQPAAQRQLPPSILEAYNAGALNPENTQRVADYLAGQQPIDPLQPRITAPQPETPSEGRFRADITGNITEPFTRLTTQAFQGAIGTGPGVAASLFPEGTPEGVRDLLAPSLDLIMSGLGAVGTIPAGAAGLIGDMAEAAGMSPNDAQRLARDIVSMPEAFAGSPARATLPSSRSPVATQRVQTPAGRIIQEGAERGVRVMTSDVREPKTWAGKWLRAAGEKIPVAGTGGARAAQSRERVAAVRGLIDEFSDDATATTDDILQSVTEDLLKTHGKTVSKYIALKDEVFDSVSGAGPVPVPKVLARIDKLIAANEGKETMAPFVAELRKWRKDLPSNTDIRDLDNLRSVLGEAYKNPTLAGAQTQVQKSVNSLYGPLREDIDAFVKANGKPRDLTKLRVANKRLSDGMDEVSKTALKSLLAKGDVTPENVGLLLFSNKSSNVRQVYKRLSPEGKASARAAILHDALDKSGGLEDVSPKQFTSNLAKRAKQIGITFSEDDKRSVDGFIRLMKATARADDAAVLTQTGQQLIPIATTGVGAGLGQLAGTSPLSTFVAGLGTTATIGAFARAYESPAMRKLLVQMSRVKPGSKQEADLIRRATEQFNKATAGGAVKGAQAGTIAGQLAPQEGQE